mmetsp:Transcript_20558/g.71138  ORF Transcript_20558/g.71138 Transcript_20558/m.71138 type:complete len:266 (-) Transcript_20558:188-985(-)
MGLSVTLEDIIKLATGHDAETVLDGESKRRFLGGTILLCIDYTNFQTMDPLAKHPVEYVMSARFLPFKSTYRDRVTRFADGGRLYERVSGIFIRGRIHGSIYEFSFSRLLLVLTTSLSLLAVASMATDMAMVNLFKFASKYSILKYQPSFRNSDAQRVEQLEAASSASHTKLDATGLILNRAMQLKEVPRDNEMLVVLLQLQQRLNSLDGMDESFANTCEGTNEEKCIQELEDDYLKQQGLLVSRIGHRAVPRTGDSSSSGSSSE